MTLSNRGATRRARVPAGAAVLLLCLGGSPAAAETLSDALAIAYRSNPSLAAARAQQRALDETVPIARSDGLPAASTVLSYQENALQSSVSFTSPDRQASGTVQLSVPVYSGGGVRNAIRAADTRVQAGQADLRGTESAVFSQVVAAYMDVIRDQAIVGLNRNQVEVLEVNLAATRDRFEIGDLTRTDVAQSDARLALARSDLQNAEANLIRSREIYIQLVGIAPVDLAPPPPLPGLPASPDEAVTVALANNPDLIAATERARAAGFDIRVADSARLPRIEAFADSNYVNFLGTLGGFVPGSEVQQGQRTATGGVRAVVPLFQGGLLGARVRQAQANASAFLEQQIAIERDVIAQTRAAYAAHVAALQVIESSRQAVEANTLSLEGVRAENSVGNRTILDILDAEQELLGSRVRLVTAERNAYVAGFSLLAAIGRAEARDLQLAGGPLYDPDVNFRAVRNSINDFDNSTDPAATATRTVDTPSQDATIPAD